jgi:2-isopropylmalate synthase
MKSPGVGQPSRDPNNSGEEQLGLDSRQDEAFDFSDEELAQAQTDFDQACCEFASGQYDLELKHLASRRSEILQKVKEYIARDNGARTQKIEPYEVPLSDTLPNGEIEQGCLETVEGITEMLKPGLGNRRDVVRIFDCTLREGVGLLRGVLSREEKVWLARQIQGLGVDIIEVGVAWDDEDLKVIHQVAKELGRSVVIAGLVRCDPSWKKTRKVIDDLRTAFERAGTFAPRSNVDAPSSPLTQAGDDRPSPARDCPPRIHLFIETSSRLRERTSKLEDPEVIELARRCIRYAKDTGFTDIEFSAMDATRSDFELVCKAFRAAIDEGATTLNLADTDGSATPASFDLLVQRLRCKLPEVNDGRVILSVHCHNTLGMATANSIAACAAGARQVECTINGIGPRDGNAALEEVVMALAVRQDLMGLRTSVQTRLLTSLSQLVAVKTGLPVPASKPIVGRNAAARAHGVDVRSAYVPAYSAEMVGATSRPVLGPQFGPRDLRNLLDELELPTPSHGTFNDLYKKAKVLVQTKRDIGREDLIALIASPDKQRHAFSWELMGVTATSKGVDSSPVASVKLKRLRDGQVIEEAATGTGPIDAVFTAINRATGVLARVRDYQVEMMVGGDISSHAKATLELVNELNEQGGPYQGRAVSQDIIMASAQSYIDAINMILKDEEQPRKVQVPSPTRTDPSRLEHATDDKDIEQDQLILRFDPTVRRNRA